MLTQRTGPFKELKLLGDGKDLFIVADGVRLAKRGHPGTRDAKKWIALVPGWQVRDADDHTWEITEITAGSA